MQPTEPAQPGQSGQPRRTRPDYDQALKRMLTRAHDAVLALLAPELTWVGERSPELPGTPRRADLVWEVVTAQGYRGLLHIELQTEPDPTMGVRIADYMIQLYRRDHLPVRSIVVYLRPTERLPESPFVIRWDGQPVLSVAFDVIKLWELPAEPVLSSTSYDLWPLASLMAGTSSERVTLTAEQIAVAPLTDEERTSLVSQLFVLAQMRLGREQALELLRRHPMIDDLIRQSVIYELAMEAGMEEGMTKGKQEGKLDGVRATVQLVLEGRFGALDPALLTAIASADEATLRQVARRAATDSLDALRALMTTGRTDEPTAADTGTGNAQEPAP